MHLGGRPHQFGIAAGRVAAFHLIPTLHRDYSSLWPYLAPTYRRRFRLLGTPCPRQSGLSSPTLRQGHCPTSRATKLYHRIVLNLNIFSNSSVKDGKITVKLPIDLPKIIGQNWLVNASQNLLCCLSGAGGSKNRDRS